MIIGPKTTRRVAADDPSWRGSTDGTRLCVDHRNSGAFPVRQTDRHLRGNDSDGGLQCRQATARAHQQTRQLFVALLAGGSRPRGGTSQPALAASIHAPGHASAQKHCEGCDGTPSRHSLVLDVAERK